MSRIPGPAAALADKGQRVGEPAPLPVDPGEEPEPASFAPVLFVVPERLLSPVEGPLPAAPGEEPAPASLGPVLFIVPDFVVPDPPSAAMAAEPRTNVEARASAIAFMVFLPAVGARHAKGNATPHCDVPARAMRRDTHGMTKPRCDRRAAV